jgi:hypothetical protein
LGLEKLTLLADEREGPGEYVHEVWKPVWVRRAVYRSVSTLSWNILSASLTELPDIHDVVLILQHRSLVIIHIQIVRRAEDCHHTWETGSPSLAVHAVPCILRFMGSDNGQKVILFEERAGGGVREEVTAASDVIVYKELLRFLLSELFQRVRPENVAHEAVGWRLAKAVNLETVSENNSQ